MTDDCICRLPVMSDGLIHSLSTLTAHVCDQLVVLKYAGEALVAGEAEGMRCE